MDLFEAFVLVSQILLVGAWAVSSCSLGFSGGLLCWWEAFFNRHAPAGCGHSHGQLKKYWLPGGCVGRGMCEEPWKTQFKGGGLCWGFQTHLSSEALNASSIGKTQVSDSKGIISSIIIIKRGFEGFLEISFYRNWVQLKQKRGLNFSLCILILLKYFIYKYENNVCMWLKNPNTTKNLQNTKPKSPFLYLFSSLVPQGHNFFLVCHYYVSLQKLKKYCDNICITKFTILTISKCSLAALSTFTLLCNHHHICLQNSSIPPKWDFVPNKHSLSTSPPLLSLASDHYPDTFYQFTYSKYLV